MASTDGSVFANISDRLKTIYLKVVQKQFPKDQIGLMICKRDSKFLTGGGTQANWYLITERNPQAGSYPNGGPFPNAGQRNGVQASASLKNQALPVQFEEKVLYAAESDEQSFVNEFNHEIKGGVEDFKTEISRQWWNDGSGVLGTVSTASGTTITLATNTVPRYNPVTRYTRPNGYVTFLNNTFAQITNATNVQISAVSDTNGTLTVASAVATAVNTALGSGTVYIVKSQSNTTGTSSGNDTQGLRSIISNSSTIYGISVSTTPSFISYVRTQNEDPTEQVLSIMKANIMKAGPKPKLLVTDPLVQARYGNLLLSYKRYVDSAAIKPVGGIEVSEDIDALKGPMVAGVGPMLVDNNTPQGVNANTAHIAMFDPEHLFYQQAGDIHWRDRDGNILRGVTGFPSYPIYQAELVWFCELCSDRRNAFALHTNANQQQ